MQLNDHQIKALTAQGEGVSLEFKTCRDQLNRDVYETVCAFLNRHGGTLLLGVNDAGKITGIVPEALDQIRKDFVTAVNNPQKLSPPTYLSNILIHREYASGVPARLIIERGKVTTYNANRPHGFGLLDPETAVPYPKNPVLGAFFREIDRADELGSGMRKMMLYGKKYGGADPQLEEGDIFRMVISVPEFDQPDRVPATSFAPDRDEVSQGPGRDQVGTKSGPSGNIA